MTDGSIEAHLNMFKPIKDLYRWVCAKVELLGELDWSIERDTNLKLTGADVGRKFEPIRGR